MTVSTLPRPDESVDDRRIRPYSLDVVKAAIEASIGKTVRRDRLERDDRAYRWCIRKAFAEGNPFKASLAQAARGMGYESHGDRHEDFYRWESSVRRALNSLQVAGLIEWSGVKRPDGAWQCIEVRVLDNPQLRTIMVVMSTQARVQRIWRPYRGKRVAPMDGLFGSG